jgi:hypothetical protein
MGPTPSDQGGAEDQRDSGKAVTFFRTKANPARHDYRAALAGPGDNTKTIVLDVVQPLAAGRQFIGFGWEARRDEPGGKVRCNMRTK